MDRWGATFPARKFFVMLRGVARAAGVVWLCLGRGRGSADDQHGPPARRSGAPRVLRAPAFPSNWAEAVSRRGLALRTRVPASSGFSYLALPSPGEPDLKPPLASEPARRLNPVFRGLEPLGLEVKHLQLRCRGPAAVSGSLMFLVLHSTGGLRGDGDRIPPRNVGHRGRSFSATAKGTKTAHGRQGFRKNYPQRRASHQSRDFHALATCEVSASIARR
jgi:hypothetical protein